MIGNTAKIFFFFFFFTFVLNNVSIDVYSEYCEYSSDESQQLYTITIRRNISLKNQSILQKANDFVLSRQSSTKARQFFSNFGSKSGIKIFLKNSTLRI